MTDTKLIDSSVWVAYLFENKYNNLVEDEWNLLLSIISLFKIKKKMLQRNISLKLIKEKLDFIKQKSIIIPLTEEIVEKAADLSIEKKIPMADSLIYITALENDSIAYTLDNHFRGLKNAEVLKI